MIHLIAVLVVLGIVFYLIGMLPIAEPFRTIINVVVIVAMILALLSFAGLGASLPHLSW
jgi:hypothetical protein